MITTTNTIKRTAPITSATRRKTRVVCPRLRLPAGRHDQKHPAGFPQVLYGFFLLFPITLFRIHVKRSGKTLISRKVFRGNEYVVLPGFRSDMSTVSSQLSIFSAGVSIVSLLPSEKPDVTITRENMQTNKTFFILVHSTRDLLHFLHYWHVS